MSAAIDFYCDFASPYAYFAAPRLSELARRHGRALRWRPILLWTVLQAQGIATPLASKARSDYLINDMARSARFYGMPYRFPSHFPTSTHLAARGYYWVEQTAPDRAAAYGMAMFEAYFVHDINPRDPEAVADAAAKAGINDRAGLLAAMQDDRWKAALKAAGDAATSAGVCGSPFTMIDGEGFFGADRLPQIERWLAENGF